MVVRYMQKTWVKTLITFILASALGWFVISRDIVPPNGVFSQPTLLPSTTEGEAEQHALNRGNIAKFKVTPIASLEVFEPVSSKLENLAMEPVPGQAKTTSEHVRITSEIREIQEVAINVREAMPPDEVNRSGKTILFLHGQRFTSKNWENIGTLALMAALGHRAVAIDLPGYGKSSKDIFNGDKTEFLKSVIGTLSLVKPVLVSPSMSGFFSMKFVECCSSMLSGFVPIAPVNSDAVSVSLLKMIAVPTLLVSGANDNTGLAKKARNVLFNLRNRREEVIEDAGHSAYLDQPEAFHRILYNFMAELPAKTV